MGTPTYIPLATVTLTSNDNQVLFSNIPNTFRDLVIIGTCVGTGDENLTPTLNGSSSGFNWAQITSGPGSNSGTNNSIGRVSTSRNFIMLQFFDYASTNKQKPFLVRTEVSGSEIRQLACRWDQTTAINQIGLAIRLGYSFTIGSTFSLFGIAG